MQVRRRLAGKPGVGRCEKEDDGAVKDLANRLGDVEQGKNAVQHGQDQRPDDGARISAAAAENRSSADDHRGHRRQEVDLCQPEFGRVGASNNDEAGGGCEQATCDIVDQQYPPYADARETAGLAVVPDSVEQPTISRTAQYEDKDDCDRCPNDEIVRDATQEL